jgi:hypothetical protein
MNGANLYTIRRAYWINFETPEVDWMLATFDQDATAYDFQRFGLDKPNTKLFNDLSLPAAVVKFGNDAIKLHVHRLNGRLSLFRLMKELSLSEYSVIVIKLAEVEDVNKDEMDCFLWWFAGFSLYKRKLHLENKSQKKDKLIIISEEKQSIPQKHYGLDIAVNSTIYDTDDYMLHLLS